jgi:hypothetical protein
MPNKEERGLFSRGLSQDGRVVRFTGVNFWLRLHEYLSLPQADILGRIWASPNNYSDFVTESESWAEESKESHTTGSIRANSSGKSV